MGDRPWGQGRLQWGLGMKAEEFAASSPRAAPMSRLQWGLGMKAEELSWLRPAPVS